MIKFHFSPADYEKLNKKVKQTTFAMSEVISESSKNDIAKAVFTISSKKFLRDLSMVAKSDKDKYGHLYEWNALGVNKAKLFLMKRGAVSSGNVFIEFIPLKSVKSVPIPKELMSPGKTGKSIKNRHVFANRMDVVENGKSVTIQTKKTIAFLSNNEIKFVPKGKIIKIINPGGLMGRYALGEFAEAWFSTKLKPTIISSGLFKDIEKSVTIVLRKQNPSSADVRLAIKNVSAAYSERKVAF